MYVICNKIINFEQHTFMHAVKCTIFNTMYTNTLIYVVL